MLLNDPVSLDWTAVYWDKHMQAALCFCSPIDPPVTASNVVPRTTERRCKHTNRPNAKSKYAFCSSFLTAKSICIPVLGHNRLRRHSVTELIYNNNNSNISNSYKRNFWLPNRNDPSTKGDVWTILSVGLKLAKYVLPNRCRCPYLSYKFACSTNGMLWLFYERLQVSSLSANKRAGP